jgi:3-hydroxymyristoyl/3-hydroxydecanoyl-(acyl carrier protein) dehydratase
MLPVSTSDLLPQQFPFQMVDTLIEANEMSIKTNFTVLEDNVLVSDSYFTEGGLIENMAQSAAAGTGYYFREKGEKNPIGYIGAVKNVSIVKCPQVHSFIETEITTLHQIGNATIVQGKIFFEKEVIASCELTIFVSQ